MKSIQPYRELLRYILVMAILLFGLWFMEFKFTILQTDYDIYMGFLAVFFLLFGVWIATKLIKTESKTIIIEKEIRVPESEFIINQKELDQRNISKRELEVLALMAQGLSNQEIAEKLYVSLNTIKTHSSKLFEKLEVKRRTQAIETAKKLQLIPPTLVGS